MKKKYEKNWAGDQNRRQKRLTRKGRKERRAGVERSYRR
jgi:hypothetical protein